MRIYFASQFRAFPVVLALKAKFEAAVFAYLISRMNADMMRLIEDEPSVCFKDRTFYIVRRSIHCGHTFLVGLCHDDAHAEILAQCAGGEKFAVEGTTLLAWYQQAIGKELK